MQVKQAELCPSIHKHYWECFTLFKNLLICITLKSNESPAFAQSTPTAHFKKM